MIRFVTIPLFRLTTREAKRATQAVAKLPRLVIGRFITNPAKLLTPIISTSAIRVPCVPSTRLSSWDATRVNVCRLRGGGGSHNVGSISVVAALYGTTHFQVKRKLFLLRIRVSISDIKVLPMRTSWSRYVRPRISSFLPLLNCEILLEIPGLESGCQNGVPNPASLVEIP